MVHDLKWLVGRLLPENLSTRQSPSGTALFDEDALFSHLREPFEAIQAWREEKREPAWNALIEHFRRRERPLGFVMCSRIPPLLVDVRQRFPTWPERLLAKVYEERHKGLAIYDRRAGPLSASFDWSIAGAGPLEDRLYGARPHRFGFLPRWALACHYDRALIADLEAVLAGWMTAVGRRGGHLAFKSSHVEVYRLVALLLAWPFLAALNDPEGEAAVATLRRRAIQILYEGSRFIRAVDGGGVANNHRLAERFADWLTAALLPEFDHGVDLRNAEAIWLEELHRQTYDDGGSIEHSVHYQEHASEMATAYLLLSRRNGWHVPRQTLLRIERMLRFQLATAGPALLPLTLGNTTEDPLLAVGTSEGWQSGFLREVQRACFASEAPAAPNGDATRETAFWLLDGSLVDDSHAAAAEPAFQDFPESGFSIFVEPTVSARLVFRLGPLPANSGIGGHSHGDLLSLYLSIGEDRVLAPPGTYSYRFRPHPDLPGQPNLHAYFAGASCRSGFVIDGLEPYGPLTGDFRDWKLPCQIEGRRASAERARLSWVEGRVVGAGPYVGQKRGVIHVWERWWLVYDHPPARQAGQSAFIGWQFAPGVMCEVREGRPVEARGAGAGTRLDILSCGTGAADVVSGGFDPLRGWVSPCYGRLERAANLRFPLPRMSSGAAFLLTLEAADEQQLERVFDDGDGLGFRITSPQEEMLLLLGGADEAPSVQWADVVFHGRLLCLSRGQQGLRIRTLGLTRLKAPSLKVELTARNPVDFEIVIANGAVLWPGGAHADVEVEVGSDEA